MTTCGFVATVTPDGKPFTVKLTRFANPTGPVSLTSVVADWPCTAVVVPGALEIRKSTDKFTVNGVALVAVPPLV